MNKRLKNRPVKDRARLQNVAEWEAARRITPDMIDTAKVILREVQDGADVFKTIRKHPVPKRGNLAKHVLVTVYRQMVADNEMAEDPKLLAKIRMKPTRTLSGVTTVTVLTKPDACPGHCIFCPNDARMPKSYLPDEPGAARAYQNDFDPYDQVQSRIKAYEAVGHPTDKIELLILGGSWTCYSEDYQTTFIKRCFDAMNGVESVTLEKAQLRNEIASHRNVGLVIETRPDEITEERLKFMRKLGVTKIQLGIQSLSDDILEKNRRGHTVRQALEACALCRRAGFKLVLHWMPNLLGANPEMDRADFSRLWLNAAEGFGFCPDEIKIYPTQLLENSDLYEEWLADRYQPYETETLVALIAAIKPSVPPYCRINRVIRDIPAHHIVAGSTRSSLRMDIQKRLADQGKRCQCIRCREIRGQAVNPAALELLDYTYHAADAEEHFLQYVTEEDKIAGYLRLSLPDINAPELKIEDLKEAAIIREIHIYGQSLKVGTAVKGAAQHAGLGKKLIEKAAEIARLKGFRQLAVIAAVGTRRYYHLRGFHRGQFYMIKDLQPENEDI